MNFAYISNTNTSKCPGPASKPTGPQCSFNAQGTYSCQENFTISTTSVKNLYDKVIQASQDKKNNRL